jgi:RNA polymerase sigma factor (sigma-70 family)
VNSSTQASTNDWLINQYHREIDSDSLLACNHELVLMVAARYGKKLHHYFSNTLKSSFDADDLLQELYGRLLCYHRPIRTKSLNAFVHTIALNLVRDKSRRFDSHQVAATISIDEAEDIPIETLDPRRIVGGIEELEQVEHALTEMRLECKKAFCLHRWQGLNHKQIASSMGVTVSMVEKHIMRVTKKLRKSIGI